MKISEDEKLYLKLKNKNLDFLDESANILNYRGFKGQNEVGLSNINNSAIYKHVNVKIPATSDISSDINLVNLGGRVEFIGDTNFSLAGVKYNNGRKIRCTYTEAGSGTCTITLVGNTLTLAGSSSDPDFSSLHDDASCLISVAGAAAVQYDISSASGTQITLSSTPPAVTAEYSFEVVPAKQIQSSTINVISKNATVIFENFYFVAQTLTTFNLLACNVYFYNCTFRNVRFILDESEVYFDNTCSLHLTETGGEMFLAASSALSFNGASAQNLGNARLINAEFHTKIEVNDFLHWSIANSQCIYLKGNCSVIGADNFFVIADASAKGRAITAFGNCFVSPLNSKFEYLFTAIELMVNTSGLVTNNTYTSCTLDIVNDASSIYL